MSGRPIPTIQTCVELFESELTEIALCSTVMFDYRWGDSGTMFLLPAPVHMRGEAWALLRSEMAMKRFHIRWDQTATPNGAVTFEFVD